MTGWYCTSVFPYYDKVTCKKSFKVRPMLVIGESDSDEYVVLPVSKVSDKRRIHPVYDIKMEPADYPLLGLKVTSYLRVHKQTIMYTSDITRKICNVCDAYPDWYLEMCEKLAMFNKKISDEMI